MTLYILLNISNLYADGDADARFMTQAETPGVSHFGAYHRPPDGHFFQSLPVEMKTPVRLL